MLNSTFACPSCAWLSNLLTSMQHSLEVSFVKNFKFKNLSHCYRDDFKLIIIKLEQFISVGWTTVGRGMGLKLYLLSLACLNLPLVSKETHRMLYICVCDIPVLLLGPVHNWHLIIHVYHWFISFYKFLHLYYFV